MTESALMPLRLSAKDSASLEPMSVPKAPCSWSSRPTKLDLPPDTMRNDTASSSLRWFSAWVCLGEAKFVARASVRAPSPVRV